jgi:hypothetical protein
MRKRKKRSDGLQNGGRAAAGANTKGEVSLGNPLQSILDIVSDAREPTFRTAGIVNYFRVMTYHRVDSSQP